MVSAEQLQSIMPRLRPEKNAELLPFLTSAMAEFAIEAPARAAAFLAQLAHESGQFRFMEEIWGRRRRRSATNRSPRCRPRSATQTPATGSCSRVAARFS